MVSLGVVLGMGCGLLLVSLVVWIYGRGQFYPGVACHVPGLGVIVYRGSSPESAMNEFKTYKYGQ